MISDIIIFIFVLFFVWRGYKSGFIKTLFGLFSYFISIILGLLIYPNISQILKNSFLYEFILKFSEKQISLNLNSNIPFVEILKNIGTQAAASLAEVLINIISFILVIIVCKIILLIISRSLSVVSKIPVISLVNRILGAFLGGLKGVILIYILFLCINFLPTKALEKVVNDINESKIACEFYSENLLLELFGKDINNGG